jgi:transposase
MAFAALPAFNTAARIGGHFDHADELRERLQQAPGEQARKAVAATSKGPPVSRWTLRAVRASFEWLKDYSLSGVWRVLQRYKLRIRSAKVRQHSPDPEYGEKLEHLLTCLRETRDNPDSVVLVFMDEMGYYRWPAEGRSWGLAAPEPPPLADRDGPNNKQWRVIGALNALTGQVDYLDAYIIGREKVARFYHQLVKAYPKAERIYVVQDNWSIHTHPDVKAALEELEVIQPVWLPTYAPWLNPAEKLWRWLREQVVTMHRLAGDWSSLRERVNTFLDQFADGAECLLRYVGLLGDGKLAEALRNP